MVWKSNPLTLRRSLARYQSSVSSSPQASQGWAGRREFGRARRLRKQPTFWKPPPVCPRNDVWEFILVMRHCRDLGSTSDWSIAAGLAQSVARLTAERKVAGLIPGTGSILSVLKRHRNEGSAFALQMARPSRGSDDHVKWRSRLQ